MNNKLSTKQKGDIGEDLAEKYLKGLGYEILGRNLSCRYGEIDIVACQEKKLHFVEIRRRTNQAYGSALLSISEAKQKRWRRSAEYFLFKNPDWRRFIPYFSVVAIDETDRDARETKIEFLPDAMGC